MTIAAMIFIGFAVVVYGHIFILQSLQWNSPGTWKKFGIDQQEAENTRKVVFNQGFYNLYLVLIALAGMTFTIFGNTDIGFALVMAAAGPMTVAGLVLLLSSPRERVPAALTQLVPPLLGGIALAIAHFL